MKKQQGVAVKKLGLQDVRVFLAQRISYHWTQMGKKTTLLLSSFSRVGLSLPIDGSKDDHIQIQGCERIPFAPIVVGKLDNVKADENEMEFEEFERSNIVSKSFSSIIPKPVKPPLILNRMEEESRVITEENPRSRRRRVIPCDLLKVSITTVDDYAYERYSDMWYLLDGVYSEFEDCIREVEYNDDPEEHDALLEYAYDMENTLMKVCEEVRESVSSQSEFAKFTLPSKVLMFADPVPDKVINDLMEEFDCVKENCVFIY